MRFADMHCDTIMQIWFSHLRGEPLSLRDTAGTGAELMIDLEKLRKGGSLLQNFALFIDLKCPADFNGDDSEGTFVKQSDSQEYMDPWRQFTEMASIYHAEIAANADVVREARTWEDIEANRRDGRISAVLTIEEGGVLQGDLSRIPVLYEEGVRMMTLTWNYENELGFPNRPPQGFEEDFPRYFRFRPESGKGLTKIGKEAVLLMEETGILPDVSHLSDDGFYDVAKLTRGPFVASHSNARAITGCNRNLTDDMIRIIGEHGGVIGLNFCPSFVMEAQREEDCRCTIEQLAKHARHIMNVGGQEVIGLGTDFDGIGSRNLEIPDASALQDLALGFSRLGFTDDEIERICWRTVLRVYREVL